MNIPQVRLEMARGNLALNQPRHYHEELERRREQERQDEEVARRLQRQNFGIFGIGNGAEHFLNENFIPHVMNLPIRDNFNINRIAAEIRGNYRVTDDALNMPSPVVPAADTRSNPPPLVPQTATQGRVAPVPPRPAPMPIPPLAPGVAQAEPQPRPQHRQADTTRAASNGIYRGVVHQDDTDPATTGPQTQARQSGTTFETRRTSAFLAGLNRQSTVGRVDAWRQHISGDAGLSPL